MSLHIDKEKGTMRIVISEVNLYDYFAMRGFSFSKEVLTRYYLSLKAKPFVILSGISGTGKTKMAQLFASYMCQDEDKADARKRVAFVSVRPDWMDNKGLLGYYNILDEKYHSTPVLDVLLEAQGHPEKPYFVILDEMNLAKVEHYFSDFLSIMESRTPDNPQGETILLHRRVHASTDDGLEIPGNIHIPANVFFAGTVNVDESTYMFSPKVLDRANVIEFNDVDLDGFPLDAHGKSVVLDEAGDLNLFFDQSRLPQDYDTLPEGGKNYLRGLLALLREHNLHFGYRVANELSRFVNLAKEELAGFDLDEAFDIQIMQKILPKLHGTRAKLEKPLQEVKAFCYDGQSIAASEELLAKARFPRSARKIAQMLKQLSVQGYVSFIE